MQLSYMMMTCKFTKKNDCFDDCMELQNDPDYLNVCCVSNKLQLNVRKCNVVTFTLNHSESCRFSHLLDDFITARSQQFRDLGIIAARVTNPGYVILVDCSI